MEFLIGMAGAMLAAGIFGLGIYLGWFLRGLGNGNKAPKCYEDQRTQEEIQKERQRLIAEQEAFRQQMEYNVDMAYGMGKTEDMYR